MKLRIARKVLKRFQSECAAHDWKVPVRPCDTATRWTTFVRACKRYNKHINVETRRRKKLRPLAKWSSYAVWKPGDNVEMWVQELKQDVLK